MWLIARSQGGICRDAGFASTGAKPASRHVFVQRSQIAGFQYYDGPHVSAYVEGQCAPTLQREPYNPYDRHAVAIYWQGHKVGYIPRGENRVLQSFWIKVKRLRRFLPVMWMAEDGGRGWWMLRWRCE